MLLIGLISVLLVGALALLARADASSPGGANERTARAAAADVAPSLRLMNYYPSASSWQRMWTEWSSATFDADMAQVAQLGAGTVRLIVFPEVFGYPTPAPAMADRLESAISLAHQHGLTVELTLYDNFHHYGDLDGSERWTTALLSRYHGDPRVVIVEVRNEIDPSNAQALTWARAQIGLMHRLLPGTPITISTSGATGVDGLATLREGLGSEPPDLYSLHYYGSADRAYSTFKQAKATVSGAPLVIGEAGYSTAPGSHPSVARDVREADQASWFRVVENAASEAGLAPVAPWILYDFTAAGTPDRLRPAEYGFGLLRTDGSPKPVVQVVSDAFAGRLSSQPYNGTFADVAAGRAHAAGWTPWMPTGIVRVEPGQGVDGGNALVFSGTQSQLSGVTSWFTVPAQSPRVGDTWTVTAQARGSNASGVNEVVISWFDGAGRWLGNTASNRLETNVLGWQQLVATGVAPAGVGAVQIHLQSGGNAGEVAYSRVTWTVTRPGG
jgi:Cellulase (glycosyl hydrolase family 5)